MRVIIAEKPSVAKEIARVFGASTRKDGYIEGKGYTFTWAFGHLLQLAPPQSYGYHGWNARNLPMLPARLRLAIRQTKKGDKLVDDPGVKKQLDTIARLFNEADEIIVATDAGREGELIFRYIYYFLRCNKPFRRLWISSQTDEAIRNGFRNLKPGAEYDTLFNSAHCRAQSDWLIGMNATQALSISSGRKGVLSLGRVQTPTLAMICARFLENREFKPEPYFTIEIIVAKGDQPFRAVSARNYKTLAEAEKVLAAVQDVDSGFPNGALIGSVDAKPRKEQPPLLHDLSSMQQEANKRKGFSAEHTLSVLQQLYESKLITYPRTGSRFIGDDVFATLPDLLSRYAHHPNWGRHVETLLAGKLSRRSVNAKKVTDHHAILPTGEMPRQLSDDQLLLYDLVVGRMLEAFHRECLKEVTKIHISSGAAFIASGTVIKSPGWRAVFNDPEEEQGEEENATLPPVQPGEELPVPAKKILHKQTKPRPLFTEAALLKAMETAGKEIEDEELRQAMKDTGLGTPATRASIIETLLRRQYIVREKKSLVPTPTGLSVYHAVKDQKIAEAALTGEWERRLEQIRTGASVQEFMQEIREYTARITHEMLRAGATLRPALQPTDPPPPDPSVMPPGQHG